MSTSSSKTQNFIQHDADGYTLLMQFCQTNNLLAVEELLKGDFDIDERCKVRINAKKTALHIACEGGFQQIVEVLLMNEADPKLKDRQHNTPLHLAKQASIVTLLLKHGANPKAVNQFGKTAEQIAVEEKNIAVIAAFTAHANQKVEAENFVRKKTRLLTYLKEEYGNQQPRKTARSKLKKKLVEKALSYLAEQDDFDHLFQHPIPVQSLNLSDDETKLFSGEVKQEKTTLAEVIEFHRHPITAKASRFFGTKTMGAQTLLVVCDVDTMNREALQFLNQLIKRLGTPKAGSKTEMKHQALVKLRDHLLHHRAESLLALCETRVESDDPTLFKALSWHRRNLHAPGKMTRSLKEFCQKFGLPIEHPIDAFTKSSTS